MKPILTLFTFLCVSPLLFAQKRTIPTDTTVVTTHTTTINSKKINYTATAGTQPIWDKDGSPKATL